MLTLNLLPPTEKENLRLIKNRRWLFFYSGEIFVVLIIFIILLLSIFFYIRIQTKAIEKLVAVEKEKIQSAKNLQEEIKETNRKLNFINEIQEGSPSFFKILNELSQIAPTGVEFNSFYYDTQTKKAILDGHALTRDAFLNFREELKKNQIFSQIESPISNLIQSTDNNFRISFVIK